MTPGALALRAIVEDLCLDPDTATMGDIRRAIRDLRRKLAAAENRADAAEERAMVAESRGGVMRPTREQLADYSKRMRQGEERIVGPREGEAWARNGTLLGPPPYGYTVERGTRRPPLVTDQDEARAMLTIRDMGDSGATYREIAETLNRMGIRTRRGTLHTVHVVANRVNRNLREWHEVGR